MDPSKAFGVEQAIGRAVAALPDGIERLRASDAEGLRALLAEAGAKVPSALVDAYLASAEWPKARAKLLLAARLARGEIEMGKGHEGGRGVRRG